MAKHHWKPCLLVLHVLTLPALGCMLGWALEADWIPVQVFCGLWLLVGGVVTVTLLFHVNYFKENLHA